MALKPEIIEKVKLLEEKYSAMGQDLASYLDGLLYADYLTYWDYIHLDTLLSLQTPITSFPDEDIFIIYHQVTELYFKLSLHEFNQLAEMDEVDGKTLLNRVTRINRYFESLTMSFDIMVDGMDPSQFMKFRMSLLPASGFQSAQYRMIEICSTPFPRLVNESQRDSIPQDFKREQAAEYFQYIYWKQGATELSSGKKTLTLKQFEEKYNEDLIKLVEDRMDKNIGALYQQLSDDERQDQALIQALRWLDVNVNINWPLSHYKSAVRYLQKDPKDIEATGGTNWQKYLPPRFQRRIFFEELWSSEELENWGKGWVVKEVFNRES